MAIRSTKGKGAADEAPKKTSASKTEAPKAEKKVKKAAKPAAKVGFVRDMNSSFFLRVEDRKPQWHLIDANGQILGRLATKIATLLRGKHKPSFTPHTDSGDYVVIINAEKVALSGDKMSGKVMAHYTGWIGGYKETTPQQMLEKHPTRLIELAVKGMMPKHSALSRAMMRKLLIYAGAEHPHKAQISTKAE